MEHRLSSQLIVSSLRKRAEVAGGVCTVLARGDPGAGGLILVCSEKGQVSALLELSYDIDGRMMWQPCGQNTLGDAAKRDEYLMNRRQRDPDLWAIELDIPAAERFAADFIGGR